MTSFRSIDDLGELSGKRILVRADLNVPVQDSRVSDDTRIRAVVPTVQRLLDRGAKVLLISHFGRPKGERRDDMSLKFLVEPLHEALGVPVGFAEDCIGGPVATAVQGGEPVVLLENLRFHSGESANELGFADALATNADYFVSDAFSVAHRAHASTVGITNYLPSAAGLNMEAELSALEAVLGDPERPVAAVVGGAKVSSKLDVLTHLVEKVDFLIIGGGMANTFLYAQGKAVGASLCEKDLADTARDIIERATAAGCRIVLPTDVVVASEFAAGAASRTVSVDEVGKDDMILDVGLESVKDDIDILKTVRTLVWNGPMGAFEIAPFDVATIELARAAAALSENGTLKSVAGGGDTVAALAHAGVKDDFSHVSAAGGAFLEWMEGKDLPGVVALLKETD